MKTLDSASRAFLLEGTRTGKLATVRADGRPHVAPIWFTLDADTLVFTTYHTTIKGRNLRRDAHAALCVDDERPPFAYVIVEGEIEISEDMEELKHWATVIAARYMGADLAESYGARNAVKGELVVRLRPTKVLFARDIAG